MPESSRTPWSAAGTANSGLFFFSDPNDWQILVKVLNACALNNNFWVFFAATTDVEFELVVTEIPSGQVKTYFNPLGTPALPVQDTGAFATCP